MPGTRSPADLRQFDRPRALGAAVPVVGIAGLLSVALLVAGSRDDDTPRSFEVPGVDVAWVFDLLVAALILSVVVMVTLIVVTAIRNRDGGGVDADHRSRWSVVGMLTMAAMLWLALRLAPEREEPTSGPSELAPVDPFEPIGVPPDAAERGSGGILVWLVVLSLVAVVAVLLRWAARRREVGAEPRDPRAELRERRRVLVGLLDEAIGALRDHPDPREATIAAWARLESALEVVGVHRHRADTPHRYLERVLGEVETSRLAAERLTATFERAMFSPHPIDRTLQLEAVDAVVAVRDELRVLERVDASPVHDA